tara:strand:- start:897 stop:1511 length:615 start_codon:yes stop_codon:yes gene_type:complete
MTTLTNFLIFANTVVETYGIDLGSIPQIITELMEFVEKMNIPGSEKKKIVSEFVKGALHESALENDLKKDLILLIDNTIETIISASKLNIVSKKKNNIKLNIKEITNLLYNRSKKLINSEGNPDQNVLLIVLTLVNLVEEYNYIGGPQKKQIVIVVIKRLSEDTDNHNIDLLATYSSVLIDTVVFAYKNKAIINDVLKTCCKCF